MAVLLGMVLCLVASAAVVGVSHGQAVASWRIPPAVLLAIFSSTSSVLFVSALDSAIAVRFWRSASRGTPLPELHYIWERGRGFGLVRAVRSGSRARTVAILAGAACVSEFLTSPLLQRATYQVVRDTVTADTLAMGIVPRIPDGWFGDRDETGAVYEYRNGLAQLREWSRREPIITSGSRSACEDGICDGSLWGAGFTHDCWTTEEMLDLSSNKTDGSTVFSVTGVVKENVTNSAFFHLKTKYLSKVDSNCMGTIKAETCYLTSATVEYPVTVQNATVSLRTDKLRAMRVRNPYSSPGDSPKAPKGSPAGPFGGLRDLIYSVLFDNATKLYDADSNMSKVQGPGMTETIFYIPSSANPDPSPPKCRLKFASPVSYALEVMHEFMFRFAIAAAANDSPAEEQTFSVTKTERTLVFQVDPGFLAASVVALTAGIVLVGALMWNWWLLGRPVTLSPLETPAALGMPVLVARPHATLPEILKETQGVCPQAIGAVHFVEYNEKGSVAPEIREM